MTTQPSTYSTATVGNTVSSTLSVSSMFLASFFIITSFLICFVNIFTIAVIWRSWKSSSAAINSLIVNLFVADIAVGIMLSGHSIFLIVPNLTGIRYACVTHSALLNVTCQVAISSLLLVTVDRFVAIAMPFYYVEKGSIPCLRTCIAGSWMYAIAVGGGLFAWHRWPVGDCSVDKLYPPGL